MDQPIGRRLAKQGHPPTLRELEEVNLQVERRRIEADLDTLADHMDTSASSN